MLSDSQARVVTLAVTRYGADSARVAAVALAAAQAGGKSADLLMLLVGQKLLSPAQAEELRRALGKTSSNGHQPKESQPPEVSASPSGGEEKPPAPTSELRRLGGFQILRQLGQGGMGSVYLAYQEERQRHVAIKVLPDHLAANKAYVDRFYREAKSVAHLDHPNIVHFIDVGHDSTADRHYLVLEYVDGPSAHSLLDRFGRLPVGDAVHLILDVARALEHAHSRRIVHRDIKPDNILVTQSGLAKLADLGLAKRTDEESHLTGVRQGFGTPYYMPYEQSISAKQADGRSDIYALGATLYHLITGEVPFPGKTDLDIAEQKNLGRFRPASEINSAVPASLDRILSRMMAREPRDRYQTASELIIDLERGNLAAPVPSFVDPELALQDPLVRARLTAPAQPTQLDAAAAAKRKRLPENNPDLWYLRYRTHDGQWRKARLTTQQIQKRIDEGRIGLMVEASHLSNGEFRPLKSYAEFRPAAAVPGEREEPPQNHAQAPEPVPGNRSRKRSPLGQARWLVPLGAVLFTAVTALAYFLFAH